MVGHVEPEAELLVDPLKEWSDIFIGKKGPLIL